MKKSSISRLHELLCWRAAIVAISAVVALRPVLIRAGTEIYPGNLGAIEILPSVEGEADADAVFDRALLAQADVPPPLPPLPALPSTNSARPSFSTPSPILITPQSPAPAGAAPAPAPSSTLPPLPSLPPGTSPSTAAPAGSPAAALPPPSPEPPASMPGAPSAGLPSLPGSGSVPAGSPGEPGGLPSLPPAAPEGGAVTPLQAQELKKQLGELQQIAVLLNQKIADLAKKLDSVGGQVYPPETLPEQPGGMTAGLMPGATGPGGGPAGAAGGPAAAGGAGAAAGPGGAGPAAPGGAAGAEPPKLANLKYPITRFLLNYMPAGVKPGGKLPPVTKLSEAKVKLGPTDVGYAAPAPGKKTNNVTVPIYTLNTREHIYTGEALQAIYEALAKDLNERGYYGVLVVPDPADIDLATGKDLRGDRKELQVRIYMSKIDELRTVDRNVKPGQNAVDTLKYKWLMATSPLKPGDLLQKPVLQDYLTSLNRFPGRHVDAAVNSAGEPGDIILDYIVREQLRPYHLYLQASNTGTESTGAWRIRGGMDYHNFIGHDDLLTLDYVTTPDATSQSVLFSYQRAILPPDKLKVKFYGSWGKFTASDVGFDLQNFVGDSWTVGAALTTTPFHILSVPIDVFLGAEWRNISVTNNTFPQEGSSNFFVPYLGTAFQQVVDKYTIFGTVQVEHNFASIADTTQANTDKLGRFDTTPEFTVGKWSAGTTFFLEPILFGKDWKDGTTWWKSTLAHEIAVTARGQYTFSNARLVPQFEDVMGGFTSVRGYPESITAADDTLIGSAEYRLHIPRLVEPADQLASDQAAKAGNPPPTSPPSSSPFAWRPPTAAALGGKPDWDLILRGFVDAGVTHINDRIPSAEEDEFLLGAGVGLELQVSKYMNLRADWGIALRDETDFLVNPVHAGDSRFHLIFSLTW